MGVETADLFECRQLLASTRLRSLEPGGELRHLVASEICMSMLKNLPDLLHKGRALHPEGQVQTPASPSSDSPFHLSRVDWNGVRGRDIQGAHLQMIALLCPDELHDVTISPWVDFEVEVGNTLPTT